MKAYLICEDGPLSEWVFSFEDKEKWLIGRDEDTCTFVLEDPMVSRKHLSIEKKDDSYFIENLSSTNPISLNDNPIDEITKLEENDLVQIGNNTFRFSLSPPEKSPPNQPQNNQENLQEISPDENKNKNEKESLTLGHFPLHQENTSKWILKVVSGPATGGQFFLESGKSYIIGSDSSSSDIIIHDLSVSKNHARISLNDNGEATIIDLQSKNGLFVNGEKIETDKILHSHDHISLGISALLFIDIDHTRDTIYSPAITKHIASEASLFAEESKEKENKIDEEPEIEKNWKDTFIPSKHLAIASIFSIFVCICILAFLALFRSSDVSSPIVDKTKEIQESLSHFQDVKFNYTPNTSTLFLTGHVLTDINYNELLYRLKNITFLSKIDDNIIIDESVYENMNALLLKNPAWKSILMTARSPGKYILTGYLESEEEKARLRDYINQHFNYLNLLNNQVVVEDTLNTHIETLLLGNQFVNINFQQNNGRVVISGRIHKKQEESYKITIQEIKNIYGVRIVKDFVIFTSESTAAINITNKYKVTGSSKYGKNNQYILINGKILGIDDTLDGMVISKILNNEIFLEKEGIKYKIDFNQ